MFSIDLSNYVATRCANCFRKCITKRPRRFALHSRDQMRRLPYLSVTIPTCWFALSWSWFAPQKMLKRCRLRPVMERAGHHEVASMFSLDLSNYVATRCTNCFRKCITKRPRRFALHSRDPMRRLPYLRVTIPTCWFALSWSWFAPQKMLKRCRLRPVMERAGHHEVNSMFSTDLSNNVAKLLRKLLREVYHQASEALRAAFPWPDEEAFPARRWGDISHTQTKPCRNGTSEEPSSNSSERAHRIAFFHPDEEAWNSEEPAQKCVSEKALKKCFLHPDEESQMGGCARDLSVIASIQRGTDFQFQFFRQQATLASIVSGERFLQDPGLEPEAERTVVQRIDRSIPSMKMIFLVRVKIGALRTCRHGCSPDLPDVSIHHVFLDMLQWGCTIIRARSWEAHLWFVVGHSFMDAVLGHDYEHSRCIWSFQQFMELPGYEHMDMRESYTGDFYDHQWPCWWWTL